MVVVGHGRCRASWRKLVGEHRGNESVEPGPLSLLDSPRFEQCLDRFGRRLRTDRSWITRGDQGGVPGEQLEGQSGDMGSVREAVVHIQRQLPVIATGLDQQVDQRLGLVQLVRRRVLLTVLDQPDTRMHQVVRGDDLKAAVGSLLDVPGSTPDRPPAGCRMPSTWRRHRADPSNPV